MLLYSTVESERAKKCQGGNKKLDMRLYYGSKENSVFALDISATVTHFKNGDKCVDVHVYDSDKEVHHLVLPLE